jgi:hypothetical protein
LTALTFEPRDRPDQRQPATAGHRARQRRHSSLHLSAAGAAQRHAIRLGARATLALVLAGRSADELRALHAGLRHLFAPTATA